MLTAVEHASCLGPPLCYRAPALGTGHADLHQQRFCVVALRETGTGLELAKAAFPDNHILAAYFTFFTA